MKDIVIVQREAKSYEVADGQRSQRRPMKRKKMNGRARPFIAYDLETTRIKEGTPLPLYITAFGASYKLSRRLNESPAMLLNIIEKEFLTEARNNMRYVAWNGNGFDAFIVAQALMLSDKYIIRPYLTRSRALRGMRIQSIINPKLAWEFLDGMSMTGLDAAKMKLQKFVGMFAPQYPKLSLDFETQEFDCENQEHVAYAERDSEALYYAMLKADEIVKKLTGGVGMSPTMGNLAIKYLQSKMPEGVEVWRAPDELHDLLAQGPLKRGGYCWTAKQYHGPIWKYDLNQAYAAAMRDVALPCGSCFEASEFEPDKPGAYKCTISRDGEKSRVPFYFRDAETNVGYFTNGKIADTWLLSNEIEHLQADGWRVDIERGWYWQHSFSLKAMVDELEILRFSDPEGPSGPLGTMVKQIGNNAYGKTLEQLDGLELVMARTAPEGFLSYDPDETTPLIWAREGEIFERDYHRPQLGCFTTSHVRLLVRSAALTDPRHFLCADTDSTAFSRPNPHLDIDARRYGAWKEETAGKEYIVIGKKIYFGAPDEKAGEKILNHRAKGLHIRNLAEDDYKKWLAGVPPSQTQTQRNNFIKFLAGQSMFRDLQRRGTDVTKSKIAKLVDGEFVPA